MNQKEVLLLKLTRPELDYKMRSREALIHVEEALRKNDLAVSFDLFEIFHKTK